MEGNTANIAARAKQLAQEGYCVIPRVLDAAILQALARRFDAGALARTPKGNFGNSGAFIAVDYRDPVMVGLLAWPKTLRTLAALGCRDPRLHSFYVSAKPPKAAALPWHSDLFYEYKERAPAELFLIYYLQDTSPGNGCLRVVPKSHLWPQAKHRAQPDNAGRRNDEADVPVRAGDLFVGDRRILHATHPNSGDAWRTCVTVAYAANFAALAEPVQALIVQNQCLPPQGWWNDAEAAAAIDGRLRKILPVYNGNAAVIDVEPPANL